MFKKLLCEAAKEGIEVISLHLLGNIKGLYCDGIIALNKNIPTISEKVCILAEELGHYHTTVGNILDQCKAENRKQEHRARGWAYQRLVSLESLIEASRQSIRNKYELAEFLDVSERFIVEAIQYYKERYGVYHKMDNYIIYFEPLGVMKLLEE